MTKIIKILIIQSVVKVVEQLELLSISDGNIKQYSHLVKQSGSFLQNIHTSSELTNWLLGIYLREWKSMFA